MKNFSLIAACGLLFVGGLAHAAIYAKYDGVEGDSTAPPPRATTTFTGTLQLQGDDSEEAGGNVEFEWKVEEGESVADEDGDGDDAQEGGNVEFEWKVEEGESLETTGVEPDEIDFMGDQSLMPDLAILLGGGSDEAEKTRVELAEIFLDALEEEGAPAETLSLNFEKIKLTVDEEARLFGFIGVSIPATVTIDADERVVVRFPWWAFLASEKNSEALGERVYRILSEALKAQELL